MSTFSVIVFGVSRVVYGAGDDPHQVLLMSRDKEEGKGKERRRKEKKRRRMIICVSLSLKMTAVLFLTGHRSQEVVNDIPFPPLFYITTFSPSIPCSLSFRDIYFMGHPTEERGGERVTS